MKEELLKHYMKLFQLSMMNRYERTDVRVFICKLFVISAVAQSVSLYIQNLRKVHKECVLTDYLRTIVFRCHRIQDSLDNRFGNVKSLYVPNQNQEIVLAVKGFINKIFNY